MIERETTTAVASAIGQFPAVAILGPRQVGKTTLALALAQAREQEAVYLDLESPTDLAKLTDPEAWLAAQSQKLVILDEVQRMPELFAVLRGVIDRNRRAGQAASQFLLLGSASGTLLRQSSESLAGRLAYVELPGFTAREVASEGPDPVSRLWLRGGFPGSFLALDDLSSLRWRQQFVTTYLERDIPQLGPRVPAQTLRRFWTMLAHEQGQTLNVARLAAALGVSGQTVGRYIDLLVDLLLVRRLPPWSTNAGKRLVRSPKVYVRDSGIVHALLGLTHVDDVLAHPVAGGTWEGLAVETLIASSPEGTSHFFYRSSAGAEIDLVLEFPGGERWAVEVKRSSAPKLSRGFHQAVADIAADRRYLVYPGDDSYSIGSGTVVISLIALADDLSRKST